MKRMKFRIGILVLTAILIALNGMSILCLALFFLSILCCIEIVPEAKKRESICLFILIAIVTIPINIALVMAFLRHISVLECGVVGRISGMIIAYAFLLNIEELVMGVIGRLIYRKQILDK